MPWRRCIRQNTSTQICDTEVLRELSMLIYPFFWITDTVLLTDWYINDRHFPEDRHFYMHFRELALCAGNHRWIPLTKARDAELWCFPWSTPWINGWVNNGEADDLRRLRGHHDVIGMWFRDAGHHPESLFVKWTASIWYKTSSN